MPETFVKGLDDQIRHKMIDLLNARLADTTAMALAVKQAHWNVKGPGFIGVHELLDQVADRLRESADLMAERAVILGGHARGTIEVSAQKSEVEPYPVEMQAMEDHVTALVDRMLEFGQSIRAAADTAGDAGDADTEDMFTEVSRQVDKDCWFIGGNRRPAA